MENRTYTFGQDHSPSFSMPKTSSPVSGLGSHLAQLRKAAGYTQTELAEALGTTQRVIAYYEGETDHPPAALLPQLAKVLGVSADEILQLKPLKKARKPDTRIERRLQQIEKLAPQEKRQVITLLDAFIERAQLKRQSV